MTATLSTVSPFVVDTPTFTGTLGELAYALRNDSVKPQQLDVFHLVKTYLCYFEEVSQNDLDLASEALPMVARVVELKVRLLLPRPPKEEDEEELLEETLEVITLLEDLEDAIYFLRQRREERRVVLPATAPRPDYPRAERPLKVSLDKLQQLASRYSFNSYFEVALERLTMAGAMEKLTAKLQVRGRGKLSDLLEHDTWSVMAITFAGMLELFKEGKVYAVQDEAYGAIDLELTEVHEKREAA